MPDATVAISLSAAFLTGLAGSGHCFAMCGGFAGALAMRTRSVAAHGAVFKAITYHAGRLSGYTLAGAICGMLGATLQATLPFNEIASVLRAASGVLLILIALRMLLAWNALRWVEHLGARFWRLLQPLVRLTACGNDNGRALLLGFLWGWLPCGLVYSTLLFAALRGDALNGAAVMLAFGLGTLPSMLTSSLLASRIVDWSKRRWPRLASGLLLMACGVWLSLTPLALSSHPHH